MSENQKYNDIEQYRPWIETRTDPKTKSKNKLLSRQLHLNGEPTLTIHTAGQNVVWELPIREAAHDTILLEDMDENDRKLVRWIYENDLDVDQYHYKK